jgi:prolyl-tRNA synthetase
MVPGADMPAQWKERVMPYKNPADRDAKHEWQLEKKRKGAHEARMERQRARRAIDKKHADNNGNGTADIREGKDVAHRVALSKGGSNKQGVKVMSPSANRSFKRNSSHKLVSETSKRERKKA